MSKLDISIRMAEETDAEELLSIYSYYVKNTAITFEWVVPSVEEFRERIKNIKKKYPYLVAEVLDSENKKHIIGYCYAGPFRTRAAYAWTIETSIYINKDCRRSGAGKLLLQELEKRLTEQNVLNVYAGITYIDEEDEYLTHDSIKFHEKMGYKQVARFHKCGYKFGRWYDLVFTEKMLGEHTATPETVEFINL